jgi:hypothetical protein
MGANGVLGRGRVVGDMSYGDVERGWRISPANRELDDGEEKEKMRTIAGWRLKDQGEASRLSSSCLETSRWSSYALDAREMVSKGGNQRWAAEHRGEAGDDVALFTTETTLFSLLFLLISFNNLKTPWTKVVHLYLFSNFA